MRHAIDLRGMAPSIPSVGAKTRLRKHALLASCRTWSYRTTLYQKYHTTYEEFIETVSELAPPRTIRSNCHHHARRRQKHACENRHCSPRAKSCRIAPLHTKTGKHHRNGERIGAITYAGRGSPPRRRQNHGCENTQLLASCQKRAYSAT